MPYDNGLYVPYDDLRFNTNLQALEYNSGNQVWLPVPVPTGDIGLSNGQVLVGNASNVATPVTLSGSITVSNTGVTTLSAGSVHPSNISTVSTDDFTFPRDVIADRDVNASRNINMLGVKNWQWTQTGTGSLELNNVTDSTMWFLLNPLGASMTFPQQVNFSATLLLDKISSLGSGYIDLESQTVIGNNAAPAASAALTVVSPGNNMGFLPPVLTTTQKNAISSPAAGLVVFDSTLGKLCVFSTTWQTITSA